MRKIISLFLLLSIATLLRAECNPLYNVNLIPAELKKNAHVVIRDHQMSFELFSEKSAKQKVRQVITVLNKSGDPYGAFYQYYDNFRKIQNISVSVYDASGKMLKHYKKSDIQDQSIASGNLFDDSRMKFIRILQNKLPYTVEMNYEISYNGILHYPKWQPQFAANISVQKSTATYIKTSSTNIRFKELNLSNQAEVNTRHEGNKYHYSITNLPAIKREPYSPPIEEIVPTVFAAPSIFEFDGSKGTMNSWKEYGEWVYNLLKGRDELPATTVAEIKALIENSTDKNEITQKIYEYVQNKTRYVSIQLGIGGFQPFPAKLVDEKGYGDCKALSNYTKALLKVAGIPSYYAEIAAGQSNYKSIKYPDFPSVDQSNHIILCVPIENDTVWLECTSQQSPYGYIGSFTDDRNALVITEEGGKVVRTKKYLQHQNTQYRTAKVILDEEGNASANIKTDYAGLQYENVRWLFYESREDQKEGIYKKLELSNVKINDFNLSQEKKIIPEATETLDLSIANYASLSGKRIFLPLNILNKNTTIPAKVKERKTDLVLSTSYIDADTVIYQIPENYTIDYIPEVIDIQSDFGNYFASVTVDGNVVRYIRKVSANKKRFTPERYSDFISYKKKVVKADKIKLVLLKKE